jgi:hypothetical protein
MFKETKLPDKQDMNPPVTEEGVAIIRFNIDVEVQLPEGIEWHDSEDQRSVDLSDRCRERAIIAAVSAFPDTLRIYIDGENNPPTQVTFDVSDDCVEEVYGEEA